jgi:hypothetical protein
LFAAFFPCTLYHSQSKVLLEKYENIPNINIRRLIIFQAALGPVAIDLVRDRGSDDEKEYARIVLMVKE